MSATPLERELRHDLANAEHENKALKSMMQDAADRIENLVESDCEDQQKVAASRTADRLRRASKG